MKNLKPIKAQPPKFDEKAWEEATQGVKKIKTPNKNQDSEPLIIEIKDSQKTLTASGMLSLPDLEIDSTIGIDNQTAKKFKREEFKVEAVLDLHGQTEKNAYDKVYNFINSAYASGKRCVIIITGKGLNDHGDEDIFASRGVLKNSVPNWLSSSEIRPMIMAYKHPSESKGGSGALYILLRRKRA